MLEVHQICKSFSLTWKVEKNDNVKTSKHEPLWNRKKERSSRFVDGTTTETERE